MPENTVYVGRPSHYGNFFVAGEPINAMIAEDYGPETVTWFGRRAGEVVKDAAEAVELYRQWVADCATRNVPLPVRGLRGKNLACWCRLCDRHSAGKPLGVECADCAPCHSDPLLELANRDGEAG